jgi:hypothetical protein
VYIVLWIPAAPFNDIFQQIKIDKASIYINTRVKNPSYCPNLNAKLYIYDMHVLPDHPLSKSSTSITRPPQILSAVRAVVR